MCLAAGMTMQWYVRIINWNKPGSKGNHMNSRSISFLYAYLVFGWKVWDISCSKLALNSGSGTFWGKTWCAFATVEQVHEQGAAGSILPQLAGLLPLDKLFTVQVPLLSNTGTNRLYLFLYVHVCDYTSLLFLLQLEAVMSWIILIVCDQFLLVKFELDQGVY